MRDICFTMVSMENEPTFHADRLNDLMRKRELEPGQLAYLAGVSRSMVFYLQKDDKPNVSAVIVGKLAEVLGCSMEYLMGMTNQPYRYSEKAVPEIVPVYDGLDLVQRWMLLYLARSMATAGMTEADDRNLLDALIENVGADGLRAAIGSALNSGFAVGGEE